MQENEEDEEDEENEDDEDVDEPASSIDFVYVHRPS